MGCRHNGLSELWAVGIMLRFLHFSGWKHKNHLSDHSCNACMSICRPTQSDCWNIPLKALVSSANKYVCVPTLVTSGMSLMYKTNNIGSSTDPCGIPLVTSLHSDFSPFTTTLCFLPSKNDLIHPLNCPVTWYFSNLCISLRCGTLSNAFIKSQ